MTKSELNITLPTQFPECNDCQVATDRIQKEDKTEIVDKPFKLTEIILNCSVKPNHVVYMSGWRKGTVEIEESEFQSMSGLLSEKGVTCPALHKE